MQIDEAIRCILDGDGLLFVGAGLSFLSRIEDGKRVPDASSLVDLLLEQPEGTGSKHPLDRVSGAVLRKKGVDFVYDILKKNFTVSSVDPKLKRTYGLPWKRIYTTNYDNAIEVARTGHHKISSVTVDETHSKAILGSIVHLNGFISRVSPANLNQGLLLTDASYAASRLVETEWLSFFENDIKTSRAVIFAGYSLYDLEIDKTLLSDSTLVRKAFFFISPSADEIEISTLERYGTVVPGGIDALLKGLEDVAASYKVPKFTTGFTCLRELALDAQSSFNEPAAKLIFDQMVYGKLPEKEVLAGSKAFGDQPYLVVRQQDSAARSAIRSGPWRDILYTGELASGKSASTLNLAAFLREEGYRVYYAKRGNALKADLHRLSENLEKIAVIFDGYGAFRTEIVDYAARRPLSHRIIMTERSAIHDLISSFVEKTPHLGPVFEANLDKVIGSDASAFEALTNFGGFWGDRSGASVAHRQGYIANTLDSSLYRLLIEIIKSEKVQNEIRELLRPLKSDVDAAKLFCSALIVNALGARFTISEWQYLFSRQTVGRMLTSFTEQVRHFILTDTDQIYIRNGVLSTHVLHAFLDDELVRDCLVGLYERAQQSKYEGGIWPNLQIGLIKFSSIEPMFSGTNKAENIFNYYDAIRAYGGTANNPDYWLQLGIAATVLDDLSRGKLCFENAYSRERAKSSPNLTRIDNYFSRFQMRQAVVESNPNVAFTTFIKANERLEKQIFLDINRHYPFKTGRYFTDIAARHFDAWNEEQKMKFKEAATSIREKAEEWKATKREFSADVNLLIKETTSLLRKIT